MAETPHPQPHSRSQPPPPPDPLARPESGPPPFDEMTFNTTPNQLTLLRIAFVPLVVGLLFLRQPKWDLAAAAVFAIASITDYFDGYLARSRQVVTVYGKLLDPLADKFLVVTALIALQALNRIHAVVVMLLICRELAITGLRALASAEGLILSASNSAKWKTGTQMVAIPLIMIRSALFDLPLYPVGMTLLYISLGISLWSARDYAVDFFRALREQRGHKLAERRNARKARLAARAARLAEKASRSYSDSGASSRH